MICLCTPNLIFFPIALASLLPTPQRSRIVFAMICLRNPNLLLLFSLSKQLLTFFIALAPLLPPRSAPVSSSP